MLIMLVMLLMMVMLVMLMMFLKMKFMRQDIEQEEEFLAQEMSHVSRKAAFYFSPT